MQISPSVYFYPFSSARENNCNTIIIDGPQKLLIDPGHKHLWPELKKKIMADGLDPSELNLIFYTHCHPDHMEAGQVLEADYGSVQAMGRIEKDYFDQTGASFFGRMGLDHPGGCITRLMEEGELDLGDKVLSLYLTPGHTPGSLCLHWPKRGLLITGDLIFAGAYGRTDFPGGSTSDLTQSIRRMQNLSGLETILPGHGPAIQGRSQIEGNFRNIMALLNRN